jgi:hypothetical protein
VGGILVFFIIMYIVWFQWVRHSLHVLEKNADSLSGSGDPVTTNLMMVITQPMTRHSIHTVWRKKNTQDSTSSINHSHPGLPTATRVQQPVSPPIPLLILESDEIGNEMKNTSKLGILIQGRLVWEQPNLNKYGTMIDALVISTARNRYITRRTILLIHSIKGLRVTIDLDQFLSHLPFHPFLRSIENQQLHPDLEQTSLTATSTADTMMPAPGPEHNIRSIPTIKLRRHQVREWPLRTRPRCYLGFIPLSHRLFHHLQIQEGSQVGRSPMVLVHSRRCR